MSQQGTELQSVETSALLINLEQASLDAYKSKDEAKFREHIAEDYVGLSDDGFRTVDDDVTEMHAIDLTRLDSSDQKLFFPTPDTGILTYKMYSEGSYDGEDFESTMYVSTVWVKRDGKWQTVLHNECFADDYDDDESEDDD